MSSQVAIGLALLFVWMLSFCVSVRLAPPRGPEGTGRWSAFELLMLAQIAAILLGGAYMIFVVLR